MYTVGTSGGHAQCEEKLRGQLAENGVRSGDSGTIGASPIGKRLNKWCEDRAGEIKSSWLLILQRYYHVSIFL